ncbi:M3 family metallopeptidase [Aureimonas fodinaquatilis]|uniref:M3 family metallopeptidase n=1 Tax=Aureimonas fodinaquatilis TaxID=2565783 RepID=UPI00165E651A|nr:M3 family metallopeptidase [Aureimonas fodinaquatilis]
MTTISSASPSPLTLFDFNGIGDLPDFEAISPEHFEPAFTAAMSSQLQEIAAIANNSDAPDFENTVGAMERSGQALRRVSATFHALAGAHTNDALQAVEREISPRLSRHWSAISLNAPLFARVEALYNQRETLGLDAESFRLLERIHTGFIRSGAELKGADRDRLAGINARLSELGTTFSQNVLADENAFTLPLSPADVAALPGWLASSLADAAHERGQEGYVLTLSRSVVVPFLTYSPDRTLRETAFNAWVMRGEHDGPTDNRPIISETLALRAEKARLLGYASFAAYKLEDTMAKTPDAVRALLEEVWEKARSRALQDAEKLAAIAAEQGDNAPLQPWDWRYYAQIRRQDEFNFDESELKPYFQLERMIEAAFDVATRLFGVTFSAVPNAVAWHKDAHVWRVNNAAGQEIGIFIGDYFARSSKRSGAWMSALRSQHKLDSGSQPIIYNICNFAKPAKGEPALLSMDDARTLFHEFGHALHGLLSDVTWPSLSGTSVARDFVELPSQLFEHWLSVPAILEKHATHVETNVSLPVELISKLEAARGFDAGFDTVEFTASALVDLALHEAETPPESPLAQEAFLLQELGMPQAIVMRHRSPHFLHIFSGDGYSSGYYSYMWSEVLDADAFEAFTETGDAFDGATAARLHSHVYSAGNSRDAAELYHSFRGRMPTSAALLRKRGFAN